MSADGELWAASRFECDHQNRRFSVLTDDCAMINKLLPIGYFFVSFKAEASVSKRDRHMGESRNDESVGRQSDLSSDHWA